MSALDELELRAAFEARRALGARVLLEWARLRLPGAPRTRTRSECVRGALAVALTARDELSIELLSSVLAEGPRVDPRPLLRACEEAADAPLARRLAQAAVALEPTAEAVLVLAGLTERSGEPDLAAAAYRRAIELAESLADTERALRGRLELARCLSLAGHDAAALDALGELDALAPDREPGGWASRLDARDKLVVARVWLAASGRYRRASALDLLATVTQEGDESVARAALRLACAHVDALGPALTDPEADRLATLVSVSPGRSTDASATRALVERATLAREDPAAREAAIVRSAMATPEGKLLVERGRAIRDGGTAGPRPEGGALPGWLALATLAHLRDRRLGEAIACLRELDDLRAPPEAAAWTALAQASRERALTATITPLLERWLADPCVPSPPRGFLDLAARLERGGLPQLAGRAIERARQRHEPEARAIAIEHAIRRAWSAYDRGDRREARALLLLAMHDARAGTGTRNP